MRKGCFMLLFLAAIYHGQAFAVDRGSRGSAVHR